MNYAFAMTATPEALLRAVEGVVVADDADARGRDLAKNHGFLKGLMVRVGKKFRDAAEGPVRVLKSGGVWFALVSAIASAIMFLCDARQLRHFKLQPGLGKARVIPVGLAFLSFIGSFIAFFQKAIKAWKGDLASKEEAQRAQKLGTKFDTASGLVSQAYNQAKQAEASTMNTAIAQALNDAGINIELAEAAVLDGIVARARKWVDSTGVAKSKKKAAACITKFMDHPLSGSMFSLAVLALILVSLTAAGFKSLDQMISEKTAKQVKTQLWRARSMSAVPAEFTEIVNNAIKVVG